ncbi:hypothetical protein Tco_0588380 [Tanacetum coccineum]
MKELFRSCHGHSLTKGNIIRIFYHGLNEITQEALNSTAGGIFLYKTPNQAYQLIEDKVLLKLNWAKTQKSNTLVRKIIAFDDEGGSNTDIDKIMARMDTMTMKMDDQYKEMKSHTEYNHCGGNYSTTYCNDDDTPIIDVIDEILEEDFNFLLDEGSKILYSIEGTSLEDKIFSEFDEFIAMNIEENTKLEINEEEIPFEKITFDTDYKIKKSLKEPPMASS